jgi:signal transduction histidine kinase
MDFKVDVPAGTSVLAPPGGLGSVLDELVGNAVKLSGGTVVRLSAVTDGAMVELHVADDGVGLDDEDRADAPRRFWRATKHQNIAGTGLGLSICAELVSSAGGEFRLDPVEPHGLDAVVRLGA